VLLDKLQPHTKAFPTTRLSAACAPQKVSSLGAMRQFVVDGLEEGGPLVCIIQ